MAQPPTPLQTHAGSARRLAALALGIALVVGAVDLVFARTVLVVGRVAAPSMTTGPRASVDDRAAAIVAHLPEVARARAPLVLFLGSSTTVFGVSPERVDAALRAASHPVTSYNLGIIDARPRSVRQLAVRVRDAFTSAGRKAEIVVVDFPIELATTAHHDNPGLTAVLDRPRDWWQLAARAPSDCAQALAIALLGTRPGAFPEALGLEVFGDGKLLRSELARHPDTAQQWNVELRGEMRWRTPATDDAYARYIARRSSTASFEALRDEGVEDESMTGFHFEEAQVAEMIEAIHILDAVSDRVVVVLNPLNVTYVPVTDAGRERLRSMLARVERETGRPLVDLTSSPDFVPADFMDLDHLNELSGRQKLSDRMATLVLARLARPAR